MGGQRSKVSAAGTAAGGPGWAPRSGAAPPASARRPGPQEQVGTLVWAFQLPWTVKNPPAVQEAWVPGREAPLEKGMATPSSILAWRVQWTDEMKAAVRGVAMSRTQLGN